MKTSVNRSVALTDDISTTKEIPYGGFEAGVVIIPDGSSITSLTWYVAEKVNGTFVAAYNSAATPAAITQTVSADKAYPIPADLAGAASLKIVANTAGSIFVNLKG